MGKQVNFTAERVASYRCEPGRQQSILWDGKTPGLGLRVTANGAKAYIYQSRLRGKTIRMTIGDPAHWPLESQWRKDVAAGEPVLHRLGARDRAQQYGTLIAQGINPREQEQDAIAANEAAKQERAAAAEAAQAEARRQSVTLGELWPVYI